MVGSSPRVYSQGIGKDVPRPHVPGHGKYLQYISPIYLVFMGYTVIQESLENTINTIGTLLGVHPTVP